MEMLINPTTWLIAGCLLIVAELLILGGIVAFLGIACLIVATALGLGFITTWAYALILFFVASLVLIVTLRSLLMRFARGASSKSNTVELLDELGATVDVVETIGPGNQPGRIAYHGTHWPALSNGVIISVGEQARIVGRENLRYLVAKDT